MTLRISIAQARRLLARYHFTPTDLPGVLERLATVQYDPLNPVGRNPDLVFQARVPGYQVDNWQKFAYNDRLMYDTWDKQACLVPISDWPLRALIREKYYAWHDKEIVEAAAEVAASILAAIDAHGPLSSLEFTEFPRITSGHSWLGTKQAKRILRAFWVRGILVTHHRKAGRHYYDRPERVIPAQYYQAKPLRDEEAYHRWIAVRRHQAIGLLRPGADAAIWSGCGTSAQCQLAVTQLVETGVLTHLQVGEKDWPYFIPTAILALLDAPPPPPRLILLGPLDSLLWDRKALRQIFGFDYSWEVYKPEHQRRWGYYVLPVFYGDCFVARIDSRLERRIWIISQWWWEPAITPDAELLAALRTAAQQFLCYLGAERVQVAEGVDIAVRTAIQGITPSFS